MWLSIYTNVYYVTRQTKTFTVIFQFITYAKTYLKIEEKIHYFSLHMAFELLFLQQNYLFRKMSFWFPWSNLWKLSAKKFFFSNVFGSFTKKITLSHICFKNFYHKFAHKLYIAVIFKNTFFYRTLSMAACFCFKLNHFKKKLVAEVVTESCIRLNTIRDLIFLVRASCLKTTCEEIWLYYKNELISNFDHNFRISYFINDRQSCW